MVRRDFEQRFVGSAAGVLWTVIHPVVLLLSWIFAFQICLKAPPPPGVDNYSLYLICGFLPWLLFQDAVQRSSVSIVEHSSLITKTLFPSEVVPITIFLSSLISHAIALGISVVAVYLFAGKASVLVVFLPLFTFGVGLFAVGLAWLISSLQVYLRDVSQVVLVLLTGWFWLTPIFIDEDRFPDWAAGFVRWNPLASAVRGYRALLLGADSIPWGDGFRLLAAGLAVFFIGGLFFRHLKRGFADVL